MLTKAGFPKDKTYFKFPLNPDSPDEESTICDLTIDKVYKLNIN